MSQRNRKSYLPQNMNFTLVTRVLITHKLIVLAFSAGPPAPCDKLPGSQRLAQGHRVGQGQNANTQLLPCSFWTEAREFWDILSPLVIITAAWFLCAWHSAGSCHLVFSGLLKSLCGEGARFCFADEEAQVPGGPVTAQLARGRCRT